MFKKECSKTQRSSKSDWEKEVKEKMLCFYFWEKIKVNKALKKKPKKNKSTK